MHLLIYYEKKMYIAVHIEKADMQIMNQGYTV